MDTTEPMRLDRAAALEARRLRGVTVDEDVEINVPTDRVGSEAADDATVSTTPAPPEHTRDAEIAELTFAAEITARRHRNRNT
jgi:hypothetical protein